LDSVVYGFVSGDSQKTIRDNFPTLSLEQIYGTIAFYLANQSGIDQYLKAKKEAFEEACRSQMHVSSELRARLEQSREQFTRWT
jgi:hypothetical protein